MTETTDEGQRPQGAADAGGPVQTGDDPAARRILLVAERLFAERGFENVSVREIAEQAGVTHPLIHYHFSSKRGLLAAVLESTQVRLRTAHDESAPPRDAIRALARESLAGSRLYLVTMARAFLDGMPAGDWPGGNPAAEAALRLLLDAGPAGDPRWDEEARSTVALVSAMLTGWVLLEDQLLDIVGLPPSRREAARDRLITTIDTIVQGAIEAHPTAGDGG